MDTKALETLDRILDEVSSHPVLRAKERMVDAHRRGGLEELIKATEKRIKATKDRDKLEGIAAALAELAAHGLQADAKDRITKLSTKVSEKLAGMQEEIAQLDAGLANLSQDVREDVLVAMLVRGHAKALARLEHSRDAFEEIVAAAARYAYHTGLFGEASADIVAEALADDLVEFLPQLIKGASAVGRAVGKTAKVAKNVVVGTAKVAHAFGKGVHHGYTGKGDAAKKEPEKKAAAKPAAKKPQTKPLARKLAGAGRNLKLKNVGYKAGAKNSVKPKPAAKPAAKKQQFKPKSAASAPN